MKTNYEFLREHAFPIVRAREVNQFVADAHTYLFREYYDVDRGWLNEDIREAAPAGRVPARRLRRGEGRRVGRGAARG
jgi:hypothetical protein